MVIVVLSLVFLGIFFVLAYGLHRINRITVLKSTHAVVVYTCSLLSETLARHTPCYPGQAFGVEDGTILKHNALAYAGIQLNRGLHICCASYAVSKVSHAAKDFI
jgi:hypothetical protein